MRNNLTILLLSFLFTTSSFSQIASRLFYPQSSLRDSIPNNLVFIDTIPPGLPGTPPGDGQQRFYVARVSYLKWKTNQVRGIKDSVQIWTLPMIPTNTNQLTNGSGYLTGINSSMIVSAMGYTPVSTSRTLTINGINYDLSGNRVWNVGTLVGADTLNLHNSKFDKPTGTSSQYIMGNGLLNTFPTIPTNTNQLTNGAGFLSVETDPNVPTYSKGLTAFTVIKASTDPLYRPITYTPTSGEISTALGFTPLTNARTLTINGTAFDLSANRSWTVGDVLTSGTYSNPTWLNSLAFSKLTGTPTTRSGYGITDALGTTDNAVSATKLVTARTINGVSFDGTANITIPASNKTFINNPNRALSTTGTNNTFIVSATKDSWVNYTINIAFALTLTTSNGLVTLDWTTDGGTTWNTIASTSNVYTLAVTLSGNTDATLSGPIPAGATVRLYMRNNSNVTITAPTTKQQESY